MNITYLSTIAVTTLVNNVHKNLGTLQMFNEFPLTFYDLSDLEIKLIEELKLFKIDSINLSIISVIAVPEEEAERMASKLLETLEKIEEEGVYINPSLKLNSSDFLMGINAGFIMANNLLDIDYKSEFGELNEFISKLNYRDYKNTNSKETKKIVLLEDIPVISENNTIKIFTEKEAIDYASSFNVNYKILNYE